MLLQVFGVPPQTSVCWVWKRQPAERASLGHAVPASTSHTQGRALPSPLALTSHTSDTGWPFEPFLLKPSTEPFPCSPVGSIVAELNGTPVMSVALISTAHSIGQLCLFSGPTQSRVPHLAVSLPWAVVHPWWMGHTVFRSIDLQPMTHSREDGTGGHWLLPIFWAPCSSPAHLIVTADKPHQLTCFFPIHLATISSCGHSSQLLQSGRAALDCAVNPLVWLVQANPQHPCSWIAPWQGGPR